MKRTIGRSVRRVGGVERVTGANQYTGDIHLENLLHAKLVYLDVGHARILSVDTREAEAMPGVRAVLTAADLPQPVPRFGPKDQDRPVMAVGETKYVGEPVAAVAAETEDQAAAAAARIKVEYEELPGVYTVEQALAADAPLVQDPAIRSGDDEELLQTNIKAQWHFGWGDPAQAEADLVVENVYEFPMVTHFAIEPFSFMAAADEEGVTIWSPIQHPYVLQKAVAGVLELPVSRVRVIAPDPGGGFGGKGYPKYEPLVAFLALKAGRPVRLALTLEECFMASRRSAATIHSRTGFSEDGKIRFQEIEGDFLIGAYTDIATRVVSKSGYAAHGPYLVPHARTRSRAILSHTVPSTAFRGFGVPQYAWALESQMEEAARRLGIDQLELRLRNLPEKGQEFIPDDTPADGAWADLLRKAAEGVDWGAPVPPHHGRGLAIGLKPSSTTSMSNAIVRLHYDGSVTLMAGTSDMGQGARTILVQLAADELAVPPDKVRILMGDTASLPYDTSTSASRSTVYMGGAVTEACRDVKAKLVQMAVEKYGVEAGDVGVSDGQVVVDGEAYDYPTFIRAYFGPIGGEVIGVGSKRGEYIADHPLGGKVTFWEMIGVGCEVEVDEETGLYHVVKLSLVSDVGKALNPHQVHAQDEGAAVMGLGHTMMEHLILDQHGRIRNLGALDYRVPTIQDIPDELVSGLLENADGPGPYGAKGAGESGILALSPAVTAAIRDATGVAVRRLPITPERLWYALQARDDPNAVTIPEPES